MILDASVLVSAFLRSDVFHRRSRGWLLSQTGNELFVPALGVVEVAGAISRVQGLPARGLRLARVLRGASQIQIIDLSDELMILAADVAAVHGIRGADAIYVAAAVELGVPLVTWDADLQQRASSIVSIIRP